MNAELDRLVAQSLDATEEMLPLLPELLRDLWALGSLPDLTIELVRPLCLPEGSSVLDLACSKGAVSIALAETFRFSVIGVDGFQPFIEEAKARAREHGVADLCRFECEDLRETLERAGQFDIVLGPDAAVFESQEDYVRQIRRVAHGGGYMLFDIIFPRSEDAKTEPAQKEGCSTYSLPHEETLRRLTIHGDTILKEEIPPAKCIRDMNARILNSIRSGAARIISRHPEHTELLRAYIARQEKECALFETAIEVSTILMQRGE